MRIRELSKVFGAGAAQVAAVRDATLSIAAGEIFGIIGRSGAGKSTLLRCINRLDRPTSGTVHVDNREVTTASDDELRDIRRGIGIIFQQFNLLDSRTARENIAFPLEIARTPPAYRTQRVAELLDLVGLTDRADAYPAQLSGGQKQRVGIARALASNPRLLLCDEATSALDWETTKQILDLLRQVNRTLGVTIILITHEVEVIRRICDAAALIDGGRIVESGPLADLLADPYSTIGEAILPADGRSADGSRGSPVDDIEPYRSLVVTITDDSTGQPVISRLSRNLDLDVTILAGGVERIGDHHVSRLHVTWQSRSESRSVADVRDYLTGLGARVAS